MKNLLTWSLLVAASVALAAEPKDDVKAAAKKLADQPNYSWVSTPKSADGSNLPTGPTEGKTEKNGFTYFALTVNNNQVEAAFKGDKSAINMDGTWVGVGDIPSDREWVANRLRSFKAPGPEVVQLLDKITDVKKNSDGTYEGKLTTEAVQQVLAFRSNQATVKESKGLAKFWVKDGMLSKYELNIDAQVEFQGESRPVNRTTTVEIKDIGSTKLDVPADAKSKL
jgi:hypothetical protein